MTAVSALDLLVEETTHSYAKIYASLLKEEFQRKRAYASIVALYALLNLLEQTDNDIQKSMTLFRNPILNEQYELSDVYVNGWHIDVRVIVDGDAFLVPKIHFDNKIQPDFYAVVKVDKSLSNAKLLGFADTILISKQAFDYHYYSVSLSDLISYDTFLQKVSNPKITSFSEEEHSFFKNSYLSLLDDELDAQTKARLLKHLFECPKCRTEFCCFMGFEMVSCHMGQYPDLLEDQTLNIIGAQAVDEPKYEGKEEVISLEDSENLTDVATEVSEPEETVSDILDELFNIDEGFIEQDVQTKEEIVTQMPTVSESGDMEIIEDLTDETSEKQTVSIVNEKYSPVDIKSSEDLEIIEDISSTPLSENDEEMVLLENEPIVISEEELELPQDTATVVPDELIPVEDEVQKVIVDYDETGEPIYSYITSVPQATDIEELDDATEIEPLEDDILNEEFETYPQENEDFSSINNGSERTVEYVENDDVQGENITSETSEEQEDLFDEILNAQDDEVADFEFDEYKEDDSEETTEKFEEYPDVVLEEEFEEYKDEDVEESQIDDFEVALDSGSDDETQETENDEDVNEDSFFDKENDETAEMSDEEIEYEEYAEDCENDEEFDDSEEGEGKKSSNKSVVILATLILLAVLASGLGFFFYKKSQDVSQPSQPTETPVEVPAVEVPSVDSSLPAEAPEVSDMFGAVEDASPSAEIPVAENIVEENVENANPANLELPPPPPIELSSQNEIPAVSQQGQTEQNVQISTPQEISNSIANAFSPNGNTVSLRSVNWLCASQLFTNSTFKAYLQTLDNILKLNLRKNILDVSERPQNNSVTVKLAVDNMRNLKKVVIAESSGSEQVDNIVLQSINETFEGEKSPILNDDAQKADFYYLKVVIKL